MCGSKSDSGTMGPLMSSHVDVRIYNRSAQGEGALMVNNIL